MIKWNLILEAINVYNTLLTAIIIVAPLLVLALPIFDTSFAIIRRVITQKSIKAVFKADRGHLHHKLMDAGLTQRQVVVILYSVTAVLGIFAVVVVESDIWKAIALLLIFAVLSVVGSREIADKKKHKEISIGE